LTNDAGHLVLNKYDISLVPVVDGVYTEAGLKAVELIRQHFIILCGDEKTALLLTQWLAHVIQHKGKLIGWGIIIQSIPGVGKSFIRMIMEYCLGHICLRPDDPRHLSIHRVVYQDDILCMR
jgi:hypothetical protein